MFYGGHKPTMRVWWSGYHDQPYSMGVLDREATAAGTIRLTLFRLGNDGGYWNLQQYPGDGPDMLGGGEAAWVDINNDLRPELVAWLKAKNDSLFDACLDCPSIIHEYTFTESESGFSLHDLRVLPSPYSTFTLFIRLLSEGNRTAAARLLHDPSRIAEAVADGWGSRRRAKAWVLEYGEETRWPRWLEFLHHGPRGDKRFVVHFEQLDGRWIISDWVVPHLPNQADVAPKTPARADSVSGSKRPRAPAAGAKSTPAKKPATVRKVTP
jgi:hypothetical protein